MMNKNIYYILFLFTFICAFYHFPLPAGESTYLRENLKNGRKGDFIVTARNKNYTLLLINDINNDTLTVEEITIPASRYRKGTHSWVDWVRQGAPQHTSWLIYQIDMHHGQILKMYSYDTGQWCQLRNLDNFLSTLLNLKLTLIAPQERKKVGLVPSTLSHDPRYFWTPKMVVNGNVVHGVPFDAWRTTWPKDGTELSGKAIEIYVPQDNDKYPTYFPYWLQISGFIGKAQVHIVDTGTNLISSAQLPREL